MKEQLNENVANQLNRMKHMMNYGLKTESKPYSSVEYERVGADGRTYGIIREGSKFHIKVSDKKKPLREDYSYIGGFANHKTNMFESYANALKHFDMKMSSINEAVGKRDKVESWNVNGREDLVIESTEKMRMEIARQREIMKNANMIAEGSKKDIKKDAAKDIEKKNIHVTKHQTGTPTNQGGDFFTEKLPTGTDTENLGSTEKSNIKGKQKPVCENVEDEFMDAPLSNVNIASSNEGDGAGQTNVMGGGVNGLGEDEDFEIEAEDEIDVDEPSFEDEETDDFEDEELEEFPEEGEEEFEDDVEVDGEDESEIANLRAEIESLRSTIEAMAEKMGVDEFDKDEPLYDDDDFEGEDEEETEYEFETEGEDDDFEEEDDDFGGEVEEEIDEEDEAVYESRDYRALVEGKVGDKLKSMGKKVAKKVRRKLEDWKDDAEIYGNEGAPNSSNPNVGDEDWDAFEAKKKAIKDKRKKQREEEDEKDLNETELHVFGKHPRFQKEPMTYPTPKMAKKQGQYEEGADEDDTNKPYATEIGDSTPFGDGEKAKVAINSIAESILRRLSKNL